jgi:hypothetical protein
MRLVLRFRSSPNPAPPPQPLSPPHSPRNFLTAISRGFVATR